MERWSSNLGFILAAVGSAVGIGNIWRFSSVVGQNGGGAYLVPYFLAVLCFAVPLMILEMAVGRHLKSSVVSSFALAGEKLKIFGWLICLIVLLILSYYLVIMGWTLAYLTFSLLGRERLKTPKRSASCTFIAATALPPASNPKNTALSIISSTCHPQKTIFSIDGRKF